MSWYLEVTDMRTGKVIDPENRDITFAEVSPSKAQDIVRIMNEKSEVCYYRLCGDVHPIQAKFDFTMMTAEMLAKEALRKEVNKRRPILLVGSPAMFMKTKKIKVHKN
jgi:hypothetical protein